MATVRDILNFVETLAPVSLKMEWDNVGLNCGHMDAPVTKMLIALDPFDEAISEAVEFGAQLLLTHHTLLFNPGFITDQDMQGRRALTLIENNIAHINAHTNLDCADGGVNDCLANILGLKNIYSVNGLLRAGYVQPQSMKDFLSHIKNTLGCKGLRYVDAGKPVSKVAVGGGACGDMLQDAYASGCDTFITADIKYNTFREAYDLGINIIDAGHFYTEAPVCPYLAEKIQAAFPEVIVKLSEKQHDCTNFFL